MFFFESIKNCCLKFLILWSSNNMVTLEQMLFSSVHLGHKVQQWNPKMNVYIYGERNGIHIIDLLQTLICLKKVCAFLSKSVKQGKTCELKDFYLYN